MHSRIHPPTHPRLYFSRKTKYVQTVKKILFFSFCFLQTGLVGKKDSRSSNSKYTFSFFLLVSITSYIKQMSSQLLCISTSFWVLRAPESWSKPFFRQTDRHTDRQILWHHILGCVYFFFKLNLLPPYSLLSQGDKSWKRQKRDFDQKKALPSRHLMVKLHNMYQ